jgi:hypothetical protein
MNYHNSLYQQVLLSISIVLSDCEKQVKVGRPPKVSDLQIACPYVISYITNTQALNLAKILIDPSIHSYHLFRKYGTARVYKLLELYRRRMNLIILILSILSGEEIKLVVDGKMSTFGIHRLDCLMFSKRFPWNAKYETVHRWLVYFIFIYTIMDLKS